MNPSATIPVPELVSGLYWGIRSSFVDYVLGNPDGEVYGDDGVETDGEGVFRFPYRGDEHIDGEHVLRFGGDLHFVAHGGLLSVRILHPVVRMRASGGTLALTTGDGEVVIAELGSAEPRSIGEGWCVYPPLEATLAEEGTALFGGTYRVGEELDALRVAYPEGAEA